MSRYDARTLYELLPAVYRQRDADRGYPLYDLVKVLAEQAEIVAADIETLSENAFIETCEPWAVSYAGDLLGVRGLRPGRATSARAEVANTLGYRRRKGTAAMLEQLARDVSGWPARVVEFLRLLAVSQHMNHIRLGYPTTADLRDPGVLEFLNGPLDRLAHSVDVRRIEPREGRHNIRNIGLFLFRLQAYPQHLATPAEVDSSTGHYRFNPLGIDAPLFHHPVTETGPASIAQEENLPGPIRRRALRDDLADPASSVYIGGNRSLGIWEVKNDEWVQVSIPVKACHLGDWDRALPTGVIAVDPVLGRLRFSDPATVPDGFRITSHYGFPAEIGGGEYDRSATLTDISDVGDVHRYQVGDKDDPILKEDESIDTTSPRFFSRVTDALVSAQSSWAGGETRFIEIVDSRTYPETIPPVVIPEGGRLILRAAAGHRPVLRLGANLAFETQRESRLEIDGLWIDGGRLEILEGTDINGDTVGLDGLILKHLTLVPGLSLAPDGTPETPGAASVVIQPNSTGVEIQKSILGGVRSAPEARIRMSDSILDVHDPMNGIAFGDLLGGIGFGGCLSASRCTVIGRVLASAVVLGENSLFLGPMVADRRQEGCLRHSWVLPESRVPRRFRCQPEVPANGSMTEVRRLTAHLSPRFTTLHYGRPAYGQLDWHAPREILRGAEDGSEMGVYSSLQQPQREDDLRMRLDEYLPVGLEAGILYAT
jgi:hypothetical protein